MKKSLVFLMVIILVISLAACSGNPGGTKTEKIKLKMSVTGSEQSTWTAGANKFAEIVKEKTNDQIEIMVFPNEQLSGGNQSKGIEMLRNGTTDLTLHSNIIYSIMDEKFGVISLPWLLPSYDKVDEKLGEGGEGRAAVTAMLDEIGVVALGFGENGFRQLTNNVREVKTPEDLEGLKIRVPGMKMYISLFKALGTDPQSMNFAEVFTALQQNTIDGQENPADIIDSSKLYEVQKYLSRWNYSYDAIVLGINKDKFNTFTDEQKQILRDAATEAMAFQIQQNRSKEEEQFKKFQENGMTVTMVDEEQINRFKEKVQSVYDEYEPIMGKELIDAFR